jgi:hypothetical protein
MHPVPSLDVVGSASPKLMGVDVTVSFDALIVDVRRLTG